MGEHASFHHTEKPHEIRTPISILADAISRCTPMPLTQALVCSSRAPVHQYDTKHPRTKRSDKSWLNPTTSCAGIRTRHG